MKKIIWIMLFIGLILVLFLIGCSGPSNITAEEVVTEFNSLKSACEEIFTSCEEYETVCVGYKGTEQYQNSLDSCSNLIGNCNKFKDIDLKIEHLMNDSEAELTKTHALLLEGKEVFSPFKNIREAINFCHSYENEKAIKEANKVTYVSENLAQFSSEFWRDTDLQRKEKWKGYKGQYVKWTFYVTDIDKDIFGTYTVLGKANKPGQYDIGSDVTVKFPDSEKEKLLEYNEGDIMTIVGVLDYYSSMIVNTLQVKKALIVPTEEIQYAKSGEYSKDCQQIKSACDFGDWNACTIISQGVC